MTRDDSEGKVAGPVQIDNLRKLASRVRQDLSGLATRVADLLASESPPDVLHEVSEKEQQQRKASRQERDAKELATKGPDEAKPVSPNLPAIVEQKNPSFHIPYFSIEPCQPKHVAQLFAEKVEPQPFDKTLSYQIRPYSPPEETVLHYLFQGVNQQLKQFDRPVRLLLLQPVKTADGSEVPAVENKMPITSVCMYLEGVTEWMEIRPVGIRIREAGVKVDLGQPAVLRIWPPAPEKGFFEPPVEFLHDRGRLVRLSALIENDYMSDKSVIRPLSEQAKNYFEAQKSKILALLPKSQQPNTQRPLEYEPFPVPPPRKPPPSLPAAVKKEEPEGSKTSLPAPRKRRVRKVPPDQIDEESDPE